MGFAVEDDNQNFQPIDKFALVDISYSDECLYKKPDSPEVVFISDNTSTAPDRRVIITNITNEESNKIFNTINPYTDREYEQDLVSEDIDIAIGYEHKDKNFIVSEGQNRFKYEIIQVENDSESEIVLETGYFSAMVTATTKYEFFEPPTEIEPDIPDIPGIPDYQ